MRGAPALLLLALLALAGCATLEGEPPAAPAVAPSSKTLPAPAAPAPPLQEANWSDLPGWQDDDPSFAWEALLRSCDAIAQKVGWEDVCASARKQANPDRDRARHFFEAHFKPYRVVDEDGYDEGLITGYYEPLLRGSRTANGRHRFPVYGVPDDLLVIDLTELYPELGGKRLRGRVAGRRVVPYYERSQIESGSGALAGKELVWVDDPIELFFLQIQGSGRVVLDTGETLRLGYADHNGHPYRSIGRLLVDQGDLPLERASMQGIKAWARQNPARVRELLNHNASYVFFRELPGNLPGPIGALGVPLTARRSIAIDRRVVPIGAPVYISTTFPLTDQPLNRLTLAQDTGGAIRGAVRADFFWGFGEEAAREAGRMKQTLRMWVLLPHDYAIAATVR
ncbi:MAG: MltA domain-containing protein [Betaproteobacteria bacterium]|nr:MltA domain-containing protein [Betaproteobacteria bacterium]MDH3436916.1 MltA domain-containing protein [Betaproteobacteria bacterium]